MTDTLLQSYLFLGGRAEEAIEFYKGALKAQVEMLMRYKESPEKSPMPLPPGWENKVMHASVKIGSCSLMLSDGCGPNEKGFAGFSLSLAVPNEAEAKRVFHALLDGGEENMPLTKTFFSPCFGMVKDRFGINWMVIVPGQM
jgi:PhnB protein